SEADSGARALVPYMTANVSFQVAKREDALLVPVSALRWAPSDPEQVAPDARDAMEAREARRAEGGSATSRPTTRRSGGSGEGGGQRGMVWVIDGNYVRPIRVRTGVSAHINTQILCGDLKEGQQVGTGDALPATAAAPTDDAKNPFAPQFRGGR